ncbi:alkaline phosphatase family protein [Actinokineospora iranica]|uniref:phospholipase C n=1 Tax=Actinokineospora iranica TaxID=1271860 RepID=A0A1G6QH23_9PSEU|nr:alkaline phosphatase family protein [Actinokineospora iranica]SDC91006.1 phospholipase C [Actinokineospora iranica]
MVDLSRRRILGISGAAAASLLPPSVHAAMAEPMRRGGLDAVEHVVVLTQENRSFDHYFGALRGVRGFGDRHPLRLPSGGSVFEQPNPAGGVVLPFSVSGSTNPNRNYLWTGTTASRRTARGR